MAHTGTKSNGGNAPAGTEPSGRREQIERTAGALFSRRGYAATSVRDIARELDLQGGSLYAHIASKEDVLWAIVRRAASAFFAASEPIAASPEAAAARLRALMRAHAAVVERHWDFATVFNQEWRFLGPERRAEVVAWRDRYEALFRAVLRDGIAGGEFRPDTAPDLTAILILSTLNALGQWYRPGGPLTAEQIADRYADLILDGLRTTAGDES